MEHLQSLPEDRTRPSPVSGPTALVTSVGFVINKAAQALRETFDERLRPFGIVSRHYGILTTIDDLGPSSQQALAQVLQLDDITTGLLIHHLQYVGYARLRRDPVDISCAQVEITPEGQTVVKHGRTLAQAVEEQFALPLTPAERSKLYEWMLRLLQHNS